MTKKQNVGKPCCLQRSFILSWLSDRGAWWAAVSGVTQSRTLKRLSSSSSNRVLGSALYPLTWDLQTPQRSFKFICSVVCWEDTSAWVQGQNADVLSLQCPFLNRDSHTGWWLTPWSAELGTVPFQIYFSKNIYGIWYWVLIESFRNWACWLVEFPSISFFKKRLPQR